MNKMMSLLIMTTLLFTGTAFSKPKPPEAGGFIGEQSMPYHCTNPQSADCLIVGGFRGPSQQVSTAEQAKQMSDEKKVRLRGYIVQSLGGEDYLFQDETGTIAIEIDYKRWRGQIITPDDLVELYGEIDKDWKSIAIDVKHVIKVHPDTPPIM